jgi:hypothetical protein
MTNMYVGVSREATVLGFGHSPFADNSFRVVRES